MDKIAFLFLLMAQVALAASSEVKIGVNGMVCGFCAQGISKKFSKDPAVDSVKVNLENKLVTLKLKDGQDISDAAITGLLKDSGYSVSKIDR